MINGGRYYRIDAIQDEEWYQQFVKSNLKFCTFIKAYVKIW